MVERERRRREKGIEGVIGWKILGNIWKKLIKMWIGERIEGREGEKEERIELRKKKRRMGNDEKGRE